MIKIRNLTKIYDSNKNAVCTAIDDISLDLPKKGFIFIVGKSGSGKSTLLNMIGTLDSVTKGDIYVNGTNIAKFKEYETLDYRCSHLGFIFQNYILLEELTVRENIALALDLSGSDDEELINQVIKDVELDGMEYKYPNELSGGQRQRVAIARALIKKPQMLLCDEPTGNLDFKTSNQILKLLKEQSKEKLVMIVSHNLQDAENYADRIIELESGKVLTDKTKDNTHKNLFTIEDDIVTLPHHKDLSKDEVNKLNEIVLNKKIQIQQDEGSFYNTTTVEHDDSELKPVSSRLSNKNQVKISRMFSRKARSMAWYTIFMSVLFISLFYVLVMFVRFDMDTSLTDNFDKTATLINQSDEVEKGSLSQGYSYHISDTMINSFYEKGYQGKIYKIYNNSTYSTSSSIYNGISTKLSSHMKYHQLVTNLGTICCDEEYLTKLYGQNGKIKVLAGTLEDGDHKVIITDFMADNLIYTKYYKDTPDYVGVYKRLEHKLAAIIDTGYKERYENIIQLSEKAQKEDISSLDFYNMNGSNPEFIKFLEEIKYSLGYQFAFTDNIFDCIQNTTSTKNLTWMFIEKEGEEPIFLKNNYGSFNVKEDRVGLNIIMSYTMYNNIFGTAYSQYTADTFVPHSIKLYRKTNYYSGDNLYEAELFIESLDSSGYISPEAVNEIKKSEMICTGLRFSDTTQKSLILKNADKLGLQVDGIDAPVTITINTLLLVFRAVGYLVLVLLIAFSMSHIVLYGISTIKKNSYEIGVLKSLGTKNKYINKIFLIKIITIGVIISVISIFGILLSSFVADKVLILAFEKIMRTPIFTLQIIKLDLVIVTITIITVIIVSIVSSLIPIYFLRKIKPLDILRDNKK